MNKILRWIVVIFFLATVLLPIGSSACGCGVALSVDPTTRDWTYSAGDTNAVISYTDGREQLVFARTLKAAQPSDKILLIPVPAQQPTDVAIDVLTDLPTLSGTDLNQVAGKYLESLNQAALLTQITPYFMWKNITTPLGLSQSSGPPTLGAVPTSSKGFADDVTVYQHLDKAGLSNEVITAKSASALQQYFQAKGLTIDPKTIPVLDAYIGKDYAFVASWRAASAGANTTSNTVGLAINFATEQIFYPLVPSSTFGQQQLTETIRILGLHQPKLSAALRPYSSVQYSLADQKSFSLGDQRIESSALTYTTVTIDAPSRLFSEDLWFEYSVPVHVTFASVLGWASRQTAAMVGAILLWIALVSALAGIIAGALAFGRTTQRTLSSFAKLGLWNVLSIIGLTIALIRYQPFVDSTISISVWRKVLFWFLFTILVTVLSIVFSLGLESLGGYQLPWNSGF